MSQDITVFDVFAGLGGSTEGAIQGGMKVVGAANHWDKAVEAHAANHRDVTHYLTDVTATHPRAYKRTTGLIASPSCTAHSLAAGEKRKGQGQPELFTEDDGPDLVAEARERSRCTMYTPLELAEYFDYKFVILENVVDVHLWAPYPAWLQTWRALGYEFETVYFNSMYAHPTPQSRDRWYFVAWKKGNRKPDLKITPKAYCQKCDKNVESIQSWKNPQRKYGKYNQQYVYRCPHCAKEVIPYYYAAANAIDWSLPAPRIGDRKKPLQPKTMDRITFGLSKFAHSFIAEFHGTSKARTVKDALSTVCTSGSHHALITPRPFLMNLNHGEPRPIEVDGNPFPTQTTYDSSGLVVPPFLLDHLAEYRTRDITGPISTMCASGNHHSVIIPPGGYSYLMTYYNHGQVVSTQEAAPTVTTLERHALLTSEQHPSDYTLLSVDDCGFRMLAPHEIQAAMGFRATYQVPGTRREQVKLLGNAVTPPVMKLLTGRLVDSLS